jgi:hypothetical protein
VDRLLRQRELDAHRNADRRWQRNDRAGYREAHDLGRRPEVAERHTRSAIEAEMEAQRAAIHDRQAVLARQAARAPVPDQTVCDWVEDQPVASQEDFLDRADARHGIVSRRARGRYEGRSRTPQVQCWTFPTNAEAGGWRFG